MPYLISKLFVIIFIFCQIGHTSSFEFFTDINHSSSSGGGKPPVFYADNGEHKTVAFPLIKNRERKEFQTEILQFLGLSHEPHPKKPNSIRNDDGILTNQEAGSLYMMDLYKNLQNGDESEEKQEFFNNRQSTFSFSHNEQMENINHPSPAIELFNPAAADTIMSFVNQKLTFDQNDANERPNLQELRFDLYEVRLDFQLIGAELRIFYNGTGSGGRVNVFGVKPTAYEDGASSSDDDPLLLLSSTLIESGFPPQWLLLNVTNAMSNWQNSLNSVIRKELILFLETVTENGDRIMPEEFGLKNAFVVAFFNGGNEHAHQRSTNSRKRRAAGYRGVSRREDYEWPSAWTSFDAKWSRSVCQKRTLYVSFRDLGWQDWIIAPDGYAAYYCYGECSFPLNAHMNASNHAIVQTLAHLMNPESVPKPCCAPNKLQPISVLYFDDSNNVVLKKYNNMVVKSCGCH